MPALFESVLAGVAGLGVGDAAVLSVPPPLLPAASPGAGAAEVSGLSLRGIGWLGGGVAPGLTCSTLTVPLPWPPTLLVASARTASWATCVALVGLGSTSVGSPTRAVSAISGCRVKLFITRPNMPVSRRLASSALFCAIACGVGVGTG